MKKKNGFTLIELLAIIVILAIIAVITVPIILNIIENSRKGAAADSAYGYKDAVNKAYIQELAKPNNGNLKLDGTYVVQNDGTLNADTGSNFGVTNYTNLPVSVSGDKPSSGKLRYSNNVLNAGCLVIGDYKVTFDGNTATTTKGDCDDYVFPSENAQGGSSSNEQGNGDNTDKYYTYGIVGYDEWNEPIFDHMETNTLDNTWKILIHETNNKKEMCMKFSDSSVCSETLEWDYECEEVYNEETSEWEQVCSDGYIARKRSELENKNLSCDTTDLGLECEEGSSSTHITISFNDYVSGTTNICPNLEYECPVTCILNADGTFSCE